MRLGADQLTAHSKGASTPTPIMRNPAPHDKLTVDAHEVGGAGARTQRPGQELSVQQHAVLKAGRQ